MRPSGSPVFIFQKKIIYYYVYSLKGINFFFFGLFIKSQGFVIWDRRKVRCRGVIQAHCVREGQKKREMGEKRTIVDHDQKKIIIIPPSFKTHTLPSGGRGGVCVEGSGGRNEKRKKKLGKIFHQKLTTKSNIKKHDRINNIRFLTSTTPLSCSCSRHDFFFLIFSLAFLQEGLILKSIAQIGRRYSDLDLIVYDDTLQVGVKRPEPLLFRTIKEAFINVMQL